MKDPNFYMLAKTMHGLEEVLANELKDLGAQSIKIQKRAVSFKGDNGFMYKANLNLRTCLRILKPIKTFQATDEKELYENIMKFYKLNIESDFEKLDLCLAIGNFDGIHKGHQEIINKIIERGNGDRYNIKKELSKIENLTISRNKINSDDILKLIHTYEKNNISELVDFCLAKKENKINLILNENNFTNEDTILIIRTFLNKVKRLIKIKDHIKNSKNIDVAISTFKPTIFWKDKEIIKEQILRWPDKKIETLLEIINDNELLIKKNFENSIKILTNFIFYTVKV